MQYKIEKSQNVSRRCMVCGVDNNFGLKARFYETDNNQLVAIFQAIEEHQSYPNITHGGISAAILDEVIGRAIMISTDSDTFGVTVELKVRYRRPVPIGQQLKAVGRIVKQSGRIFEGTGELYLPDGEIAVEAHGRYMKRRLEQITEKDFRSNEWFLPGEDLPEEISL